MTYERSAMAWNLPADPTSLAHRLRAGGATRLWVKAGVDNPGLQHAWEQWTDGRLDRVIPLGLEPVAWFYVYPEGDPATQYDTIVRALSARGSRDICLNAEVEWDDVPDATVLAWVQGLRNALAAHGLPVERIGFSSVPSWDKGHGAQGSPYHNFPYEAWCQATDFSMPQDYFVNPDEILFENRRNTTGKPVFPILTACGEMTDSGVLDVARRTLAECQHFAGFSSWECANGAYQFDAVAQAYALIPEEPVVAEATSGAAGAIAGGLSPSTLFGPFQVHLGGGFLRTYQDAGADALGRYGFPVTEEITENGKTVQYFERARFEYDHATGAITFGRVGVELARARGLTTAQ